MKKKKGSVCDALLSKADTISTHFTAWAMAKFLKALDKKPAPKKPRKFLQKTTPKN